MEQKRAGEEIMNHTAIENKAKELLDAGILETLAHRKHIYENDVKAEVAKQVESDQVEPVAQKIFAIAEASGIIKDGSWYTYHYKFIRLTVILFLIYILLLIYRTRS